jgi:CubicO group peptidase (beta-lactamase class C family)
VLCYEDTWLPQQYAAEKIFGVGSFRGHLPVSPEAHYKRGMGISALEIPRLSYRLPEEAGIASDIVSYIDTIVHQSIADTAMPGCQVLASVRGKVIYSKAFGYHTYDSMRQVKVNDLYDIASVTKIAATALALMHLEERNKIEIEARASKYLPELKNTNKRDLTLRELMAHQAGLRSWIPFWLETVDSTGLDTSLYRFIAEDGFNIQLGDSLFLADSYRDTIWQRIIASPVENRGRYVYSDLGLFILQKVVEKVSGESLDEYVRDTFYRPMGLWQCVFKPLEHFSKEEIVPTEKDTAFRRQLVHGYVHDPAAAMLGGVAGNAGLFSNAHSLAVIMQMLMNGGSYGGRQYLKQATVDKFTVQAFPGSSNRRGLLFDKPDKSAGQNGPTAEGASSMAFGHSGFTGTCAWADPETGLVYVFLSNRVHPDASNNKLARNNVRTRVMQVLYDGLNEK